MEEPVNSVSALATLKFVLFEVPFSASLVAESDSVKAGQKNGGRLPAAVFVGHKGSLAAFGK
ncbi:MAG: hypothetical protein ABR923_18600 [Terracidiphilus sp.]